MAALALADVLVDFGMRRMRAADVLPVPHPAAAPPSQQSIAAIVAAEVARAEAALTERLSIAHAAELEAERERHQAEIAALQQRHGAEAGAALAAACATLEQRFEQAVVAPVARVLGRLTTQDLSRRSVAALHDVIAEALRDRDAVRIVVSGPAALCQGLAEALGERAAAVDFREAGMLDLAVSVDGALLESRVAEWSSLLSELVP